MVIGNLPDGWEWKRLGDITRVLRGASPRPKGNPKYYGGTIPWIKISDVTGEKGKYLTKTVDTVTEEGVKKSRFLSNGSLILSICATVCVPKILSVDGCIHDGFVYFPDLPADIDKTFLYYYFESIRPKVVQENRQGMTQVNLNTGIVSNFQIPVLPLPEQERIVSRIEELFSDLEAGVASLERVRAGLKRYKASVLKAAVEGKLLKDEGGRIKDEDELPEGWRWAKLSEIAEVRLGRQRSPARAQGPNMRQYMRAANVTWHGIDLTDVKEMDFSPREQETYRLKYGDILLSEASGSVSEVGKPAVWRNQLEESYIQNTLIRVRPYKDSSEYLYYHFLYDAIAERFRKIAKGVGIHHLGAENLSNWVVSLPPLEEQRRIVAEVERRLSVIGEVQSAVEVGLARAGRLRQAVLRSAFEGRL